MYIYIFIYSMFRSVSSLTPKKHITLLTSMGLQLEILDTLRKFHLMVFFSDGSSQVKYIVSCGCNVCSMASGLLSRETRYHERKMSIQ